MQAIHHIDMIGHAVSGLVASLANCPRESWIYRSDPESETTCVLRAGSPPWFYVADGVEDLLREVATQIFPPGYTNRVVLSCVPASGYILPHTDDFGAEAQSKSVHCHIPIITHPDVVMGYGENNTEVHMQVGHLYIVDAAQRHYVRNPSRVDRVHLLFAYFPHNLEDLLKCYVSRRRI